jgi:anti-anti-sigma factor
MSEPPLPHESAVPSVADFGVLGLASERTGSTHVIALRGELDVATVPEVDAELKRAEATDATAIVVDLSELQFIDSTGLRLFIEADLRSRADSCRLTLLRPPAAVGRIFAIAGLDDSLPFEDA